MKNTYKCDHCGHRYVGTVNSDPDDDAIYCEGQEGCPRCDGPQATIICQYCGKPTCECINTEKVFKEVSIEPLTAIPNYYFILPPTGEGYADIGCLLAQARDANDGDMVEECDWHEDLNIRDRVVEEDQLVCMWYVKDGNEYRYFGIVEG